MNASTPDHARLSPAFSALGPDGALAAQVAGFTVRTQQCEMADQVWHAILNADRLICEAGTGTGKTLAYLVPAVLAGKKVLISTGTRTLQDQLYHRDLPMLRTTLGSSVKTALLKGRANYLCLHRLEVSEGQGHLGEPELQADLAEVRAWASVTRRGDIAELSKFAEQAPVWRHATSTRESCLGQECPHHDDCHVLAARRRAQTADIVVVNHHLFFADMVLRDEGMGEFLPDVDAIIVDEAHQLPDLAAQFFGVTLTSRQLLETGRETEIALKAEAPDTPDALELVDKYQLALGALEHMLSNKQDRVEWSAFIERPRAQETLSHFQSTLRVLCSALEQLSERGKAIAFCARQLARARQRLEQLLQSNTNESVSWIESRAQGFSWRASPLDVSGPFSNWLEEKKCALVMVSATLSVNGSTKHFEQRLGIDDAKSYVWSSPFDYPSRTLLYVPLQMPEPNDPQFAKTFTQLVCDVVLASEGCAFILFTSHRALGGAVKPLRAKLHYPLLVQGDHSRGELLRRFRTANNAVLLGTYSFWEGVDVPGDALRCVVIDKLPFAPHTDPLNKARHAYLRAKGEEPFMAHQVPHAVLALKQGVGRLMRAEDDFGVVVVADHRIVSRGYGKAFIKSLPAMPISHELTDVQAFYRRWRTAHR